MSSNLENIFNNFRGSNHKDIDCRGFVKLCRDTGLVDDNFSANDAERVFQRSMPVSKRRLNLKMLRFALQVVAEHKGVELDTMQHSMNASLNCRADLSPPVALSCMMHSCMKRTPSVPAAPAARASAQMPDAAEPRSRANLQPPAAGACMMHSCMKRFPSATSATSRGFAKDDADARPRSEKQNRGDSMSKSFTLSNTFSISASSNHSTSCGGSEATGDTNSSSNASSPKVRSTHNAGSMENEPESEPEQPPVHLLPSNNPGFCLPLSRLPAQQAEVREEEVEQPPMSQSPTAPPPLQTPKGSQTRNPRGDLQSHLSQGQSLRRGKPANLSSPKLSAVSVEEVYAHFCGGHAETEMDCKSFLKMCKRACLIDQSFTSQDARLIFGAVVHVSKQRMDFHSFEAAIGRVAVRKGIDVNLVRRMVAWSIQSGTESESSLKQSAPKSPAAGDESTSRTWPEQACTKLNLSSFMSGNASSLCTASSLSTFRRSQSVTVLQREQDSEQASGSQPAERRNARSSSIERSEQIKAPEAYAEPAFPAPTVSAVGGSEPRGRVYTSMPLTSAVTRPRRRTAESQPPSNSNSSYVDYPTPSSQIPASIPSYSTDAKRKKVYTSMPLVSVTVPHNAGQTVGSDRATLGAEGSDLLERPERPAALAMDLPERPERPAALAMLAVPGLAHRRFYPSMPLSFVGR